jgi:aryl-alcohol dehydrogenase-like predicted oxidoreductase
MAGGFMSGRITRTNTAGFTDYFGKLAVECYASEDNFQRVDRAAELASAKGLSMPQIALAYVLNYPLNIYALVGSANADEMTANAAASLVELTPAEMDYLDLKVDSLA